MKKKRKVLALLLAATMAFSSMPGSVVAKEGTRPEDSTTQGQPFLSGTGGSEKFRIPCLVSLNDGTLVAGCDARWTTNADGGGLDTIVSYSKDGGTNWNYTFANYLGDNGNVHNTSSTAFIDPAMATDGETVYMIADLYPAGYALNGAKKRPVPGKSHDDKGNILLADARKWTDVWGNERTKSENYTYYLEKNEKKDAESAYLIKKAGGEIVDGYTVDAHFNIKGKDVNTNLFEAESPFQVWPTDYLYMTTSDDAGKTWSEPSILNLRKQNEQSLLVGPGRGMVTSEGRIIFTAYEFTNGDKNSAAIYSDDGGRTWKRGKSVSGLSSEAVVTEADGKLYMFTRHGGYYVSNDWGETWSGRKDMGITYNLGCQLTAVTYPEKIDGKTAILFAAPSNTTTRAAGKIFVGLVQEDGTLKWTYDYSINGPDYYAYSCLTILPDGTIGLLYESGWTELLYTNLRIEDIVKGGTIGNIWCTDSAGKNVSEVFMKSNETKQFTINGLKENDKIHLSTDNDVVKPTYENGKLTLTSSKAEGLEHATVTIKTEKAETTIKVYVTDSTKYEVVNLRVGDTKTYTDKTGNYSGSDLAGLDKKIADVKVTGEESKVAVKAQLATKVGDFSGAKKSLDDCLFTFSEVSGQQNTYNISGKDGNTTVYLSHKASVGQCPCSTTRANVVLEQQNDGKFAFKDTSSGGGGQYLYFYTSKNNGKYLHFDRQNSVDNNCKFELYKKEQTTKEETGILGYEKVTELSQVKNNEKYLIAVKADDGKYYVLNPSTANQTAQNFKHVAKVVEEKVEVKPEAEVQFGTTAEFNGEKKGISSCLLTFDKQENGKYVVSGTTASGEKVYLTPKTANSGNTPFTKTQGELTVAKNGTGFTLHQDAAGGAGGYLYFWKNNDNGKYLYFDRNGKVDDNGRCTFDIYKASADAKNSEISGYVKVTELTELEDNGQYLVVSKANDNKNYLLHPSQNENKYDYVAKVTGGIHQDDSAVAKTEITITAKTEGETSVKIGETTYYIIVKNNGKEVTLKVGQKYNVPGKIVTTNGDTSIIKIKERDDMAPYKVVSTLGEGKYVFGNVNNIVLNTPSTAGDSPKGLGMKWANYNTSDYSQYTWTLKKSGDGYTMKDSTGKYLNINGQNVELKSTEQVLKINSKTGGFSVSNGGYYLNNWGNSNNKVAGWNQDNNTWSFFKASEGTEITAEKVGKVTLSANGTTYYLTVVEDQTTCEHVWGDWVISKEPSCTTAGEEIRVCEKCQLEEKRTVEPIEHTETLRNEKAPTCTEEGYTGDTVCTMCNKVIKKGEVTKVLGHDFENAEWEITKTPTCTETGEKTRQCTRFEQCGKTETEVIKALGHKYGDWEVVEEPTATEDGYEERVCELCKARQTKVLPATGENNNNGGDTGNQNNGGTAGNSGNHNNSGNSGNSGNQNQKPVKTGDMADPLTTALGMAGCLGAIIAILRRKSGK